MLSLFLLVVLSDVLFLPRDKASEFASITPQQLLRETQSAAGLMTLIDFGRELRLIQEVMLLSVFVIRL
jgi:hypothetical protein